MTDNNHPITPPPELVQEWTNNDDFPFSTGTFDLVSITKDRLRSIATQAARWGDEQRGAVNEAKLQKARDEELDACCEWASQFNYDDYRYQDELRTLRRPKPPSLKEQALEAVQNIDDACESEGFSRSDDTDIIRRALESLPS